jgi:hypothetical protein
MNPDPDEIPQPYKFISKYKPPELKLEYPCWVTYALTGKSEDLLLEAVHDVIGSSKHRLKYFDNGKKSGPFSFHVIALVTSDYQRTEFFHNFQMHRGVKAVL